MKVKELIKMLERNPEAEVYAYDADAEEHVPVTGSLYYPSENREELQTDSD